MKQMVNNNIRRFPLPDGNVFEYDVDLFAKMVYGRIYDENGRLLATARQAIWPWTKMTPEQMYQKTLAKL